MATIIRNINNYESYERIDDKHIDYHTIFSYFKINPPAGKMKIPLFQFDTVHKIERGTDYGMIISGVQKEKKYSIWIPDNVVATSIDNFGRLVFNENIDVSHRIELTDTLNVELSQMTPVSDSLLIGIALFEDVDDTFLNEIRLLDKIEKEKYIKSKWFIAQKPSDIWKYLINGSIYDPLPGKGTGKRYKCQQCAYAWWTYFNYLNNKTGKIIYSILQNELAHSIAYDMDADGSWKHGAWCEHPETHTRFQLDGIQLLLAQYKKTREGEWLHLATKGIDFVVNNLVEKLPDGSVWFLHDTVEIKRNHKIYPRLLGKNKGNSLTINTHMQVLHLIAEYKNIVDENNKYEDLLNKGMLSLEKVLSHRPAELLYKLITPWILKHKLRGVSNIRKDKIIKIFENYFLPRMYWYIRYRYPRIVYPNGFTERDISLCMTLFNYHIINIKDMLFLYKYQQVDWLRECIIGGFNYIKCIVKNPLFKNMLERDYTYVEVHEVFLLYDRMVENVLASEIYLLESTIKDVTGGVSLDAALLDS